MNKIIQLSNFLLILFFLVGLILLGWRNTAKLLEEKPETLNQLRLDNFKASVQDFNTNFEDQAGKDEAILNPLAKAKYRVFNNALTRKIIPGKEGWLFLWEETEQIDGMKQVLGKTKLSQKEIKNWRVYTDQRRAFLETQGIPYFKIIAPNKASIYPEYLPEKLAAASTSFTDQLLEDLQKNTNVKLIDLRLVLKMQKDQGQLYYKTDTHWNNLGAFYAAQFIMKRLEQEGYAINQFLYDDFKWTHLDKAGGDVARLMLMQEELRRDYIGFEALNGYELINEDSLNERYQYLSPFITTCSKGKLPKTILFHDSFATNLRLFLAYHFESLYSFWLWGAFDAEVVLREKPAIVLDELVERRLVETQHVNSAPLINAYWEANFERLSDVEHNLSKSTLNTLAENLGKLVLDKDKLLIVQLDLKSPIKQTIKLANGKVRVPYVLSAGHNKIHLQLDLAESIQIITEKDSTPIIQSLRLKSY